MKAKPFTQIAQEQFIIEHLENGRVVCYDDPTLKRLEFHYFDELQNAEIRGFPFSSDLVAKDGTVYTAAEAKELDEETRKGLRLRYAYLPNCHDLYVGTTGSGKTTGCIEPQIRALSTQKNKPNLFVTDPKGELFEHNARYLRKQGYDVFVLNFKDFGKTDRWNPLLEIYQTILETRKVGDGYEFKEGQPSSDLEIVDMGKPFENRYFEYKGKAFACKEDLDRFLETENYLITTKVSSLINQFCAAALPTKSTKDPSWEEGARGFLFGIIMGLAEDAADPSKELTADRFTLKTLFDTYALLRESVLEGADRAKKQKAEKFLANKSKLVREKINGVLQTADSTRKGYFSTFESRLVDWAQGHIYVMTTGTTINIDRDNPFAIFISTRDYEKSDFIIASTFIDWVYRQTLIKAEKAPKDEQNNPLTRDVHFLLDEFGNIPAIPSFENKIATARSRKIWFHLIIQSYEQIELIYGQETAKVVIDNCNMQVFLGSQSLQTKERFSRECGKKSVKSLDAYLKDPGTVQALTEVSVVPVSQLDLIEPGQFYCKRLYYPVIKGRFIRSYHAADMGIFVDFRDAYAFRDIAPINNIVPEDAEHTYLAVGEVGKKFVSKVVDPTKPSEEPAKPEGPEQKTPKIDLSSAKPAQEEKETEKPVTIDDFFSQFSGGGRK